MGTGEGTQHVGVVALRGADSMVVHLPAEVPLAHPPLGQGSAVDLLLEVGRDPVQDTTTASQLSIAQYVLIVH